MDTAPLRSAIRSAGGATGAVFRESSARELAALLARAPLLTIGTPGYGRPVLLIPGFGVSDASLLLMSRWLRTRGYRTHRSKIGINVGCSERQGQRLEARLEQIAAERGERVAIIGHSRGGILAKALAGARPDLVAGIVTLGSPTRSTGPTKGPAAWGTAQMVGSGHLPNLLSWTCLSGTCPTRFRTALTGPFPASVGFVSIYSRSDRIAAWRSCRHSASKPVEVDGTHLGLAHNPAVYAEVARALPTFWTASGLPWLVRVSRQTGAWARALAPL